MVMRGTLDARPKTGKHGKLPILSATGRSQLVYRDSKADIRLPLVEPSEACKKQVRAAMVHAGLLN